MEVREELGKELSVSTKRGINCGTLDRGVIRVECSPIIIISKWQ